MDTSSSSSIDDGSVVEIMSGLERVERKHCIHRNRKDHFIITASC